MFKLTQKQVECIEAARSAIGYACEQLPAAELADFDAAIAEATSQLLTAQRALTRAIKPTR